MVCSVPVVVGWAVYHSSLVCLLVGLSSTAASELPERLDLSVSPYFPPVIRQTQQTCAQEVGISTMMTYEWNRLRGTPALPVENRFAGRFLWNFLNRGENRGAELAEGWELAREIGVPTQSVYEKFVNEDEDAERPGSWPHGYALYHDAMQHRLRGYRFFTLSTVEDLERAKRWLWERGEERQKPGGLLAIEGRLRGFHQVKIPEGQVEAGKSLVLRWGRQGAGHVMTYAGYDDRVGHDINGDGRVSNDCDLNGDGRITLADWERGAFIAVNSYGTEWGDSGKTYVLYRESAVTPFRRGRWAAVIALSSAFRFQPRLTAKLTLQTNCQTAVRLRFRADEGPDFVPLLFDGWRPSSPSRNGEVAVESPEQYSRFHTGERRLSLGPARQDGAGRPLPVEIGIDLTGRLPLDAERYVLEFHLDSDLAEVETSAEGVILEASLRRYGEDGALEGETAFAGLPRRMRANEERRATLEVSGSGAGR